VQRGFGIKRECDRSVTAKMCFYPGPSKHSTRYSPDPTKPPCKLLRENQKPQRLVWAHPSQVTCRGRESGREGVSVLPPHVLRKLPVLVRGTGEGTRVPSITQPALPRRAGGSWKPPHKQPQVNTPDRRDALLQRLSEYIFDAFSQLSDYLTSITSIAF